MEPIAETDSPQRRLLTRNRLLATGLLVAAALAYVALSVWYDPDSFWIAWGRAATEAAMIGALADWFAVTALFRRPMGLPIPHTAIVPRHKDRIAEGLGGFIEKNFLDPALIAARLKAADPASRLARFLSDDANASLVADRIADGITPMVAGLDSDEMRGLFARTLGEQLRRARFSLLLGRTLDVVLSGDHHAVLIERLTEAGHRYLDRHEQDIEQAVEKRTAWWMPRQIDRRMARGITQALRDWLNELAQPGSVTRGRLEEALRRYAYDLRQSAPANPSAQEDVEAAKDRLLDQPEIKAVLGDLWDGLRRAVVSDLADRDSATKAALRTALKGLATALQRDEDARREVNDIAVALVEAMVVPSRAAIGRFVADVVKGWDTATVVGRLELAVGPDLQYVRISGTLVAAAIGSVIFFIDRAFL
ncbi:MAG: DUF445 domain-containing protein [Pseudomonadota bacterium]